ncbi:MarR family winged helix-turn-helix transcriptional regulator [Umezawaea tangerina]|uniref:DNA-binding MarR family transcriptional regulator n=1 Tax=Umezawaea tangerina TaxID=84725 RepID=A0A2T0TME2_9PSEU|nr:MarR family transcriptional regulator [Umezawaea tangerina]PRY46890.1 DNA-binding MarR family transcriptional regulator [Umezawaea tangerina]
MTEPSDALLAWLYAHQGVEAAQAAMSERMESVAGCSLLEHSALYRLKMNGGRLRMLDLSDYLSVSPSGGTRLVERLVKRGWVAREQPEDNRRLVHAVLTAEGRRVLERTTAPAYRDTVAVSFSDHLSDRDVADLKRIGRKLLEAHGRWDAQRFATD